MTESLLKKSHKSQNDKGLNVFSPQKAAYSNGLSNGF